MKLIKIIITLLFIVTIGVYIILFTSLNKSIIVPIIQTKVSSALKINDVKVSKFELTASILKLTLLLQDEKINLDAKFGLLTNTLDATYDVKIKDLSIFNKVSGQKLKGTFDIKGQIKGAFDNLKLQGNAQVANGDIDYKLKINAGDVKDIIIGVKKLKLAKLLDMVNQPQYAKADINIGINIKSLNNLDGKIVTTIDDGLLNANFVKKDFNIILPSKPIFNLKATTLLAKNIISTKSNLNTFAATIQTTKTIFDIKTAILNTDYILDVSNLNNLFFITKQKMQGNIKIIGDVKLDKSLRATFKAKKFDGTIAGIFENNKLKANIKDINSLQLLNMMYYPKVFSSKVNIDLDYDVITKKGISNILMSDGQFLASELSQTIRKITKKDLTAEIYKKTAIQTKINDKILESNLVMESKHSQINSKKIYVNLNKSYIDAIFDMVFYKIDISLGIKGELIDPKIKVNTGKMLKSKMKKEVDKVKTKVEIKVKKEIGNFLKKLF